MTKSHFIACTRKNLQYRSIIFTVLVTAFGVQAAANGSWETSGAPPFPSPSVSCPASSSPDDVLYACRLDLNLQTSKGSAISASRLYRIKSSELRGGGVRIEDDGVRDAWQVKTGWTAGDIDGYRWIRGYRFSLVYLPGGNTSLQVRLSESINRAEDKYGEIFGDGRTVIGTCKQDSIVLQRLVSQPQTGINTVQTASDSVILGSLRMQCQFSR